MGTVLLGDVGHEVEDTAGVAPLLFSCQQIVLEVKRQEVIITLSYHETNLMKFSFRAIPALASKMEEAGLPLRSEETSSSSE